MQHREVLRKRPPDDLAATVRAIIQREGLLAAVALLNASRESITRIAAGLRVRAGTMARVQIALSAYDGGDNARG